MEREYFSIGGVPTPVFYPSVSGVSKNVWSVVDHIELLVAANFPQFLVSCLDVHNNRDDARLISSLEMAEDQSQVLLYDSGTYEVVWSKNKGWNREKYLQTLQDNRVSHAFCLDEYVTTEGDSVTADAIVEDLQKTRTQVGGDYVSPILHKSNIDEYVDISIEVNKKAKPRLLAIPERELGFGVVDVARNIARLRKELNKLDEYQAIHILGTGNPISMMIYAFMGADSFDGLDWCQTVVDYETATLHHTWHFDLYAHQGDWGSDDNMNFLAKCFMHNLDFYKIWMEKMAVAIQSNNEKQMIEQYIKGPQKEELKEILGK